MRSLLCLLALVPLLSSCAVHQGVRLYTKVKGVDQRTGQPVEKTALLAQLNSEIVGLKSLSMTADGDFQLEFAAVSPGAFHEQYDAEGRLISKKPILPGIYLVDVIRESGLADRKRIDGVGAGITGPLSVLAIPQGAAGLSWISNLFK